MKRPRRISYVASVGPFDSNGLKCSILRDHIGTDARLNINVSFDQNYNYVLTFNIKFYCEK